MTRQNSPLIFTTDPLNELLRLIEGRDALVFTDTNCLRLIERFLTSTGLRHIEMEPGEAHKNLDTVVRVWSKLQEAGCTRKSVLVNFGGGVVTDLGGFAAATFKRGIDFINIPTTLLAAVDASVGGKTGIDFNGLKNEIGVFKEAAKVIISTDFFGSLPYEQILSGYAEMIKHGLLTSPEMFGRLLNFDIAAFRPEGFLSMLEESVRVKERVVRADPTERGVRRFLNLGHTVGHAVESLSLARNTPLPHGYAVAVGLVTALVLSHLKLGLPTAPLHVLARFVRENYGGLSDISLRCNDYEALYELMSHDKKNPSAEQISFTLLRGVGDPVAGQIIDKDTIFSALDITRDLLGVV